MSNTTVIRNDDDDDAVYEERREKLVLDEEDEEDQNAGGGEQLNNEEESDKRAEQMLLVASSPNSARSSSSLSSPATNLPPIQTNLNLSSSSSASSSSSSRGGGGGKKLGGLSDVISKLQHKQKNTPVVAYSNERSGDLIDSSREDRVTLSDQEDDNDDQYSLKSLKQQTTHEKRESANELYKLLESANLLSYLSVFIQQGGDDVNQLCDADDAEFKEICDLVGMSSKPLHVKRLKKSIDELKMRRIKSIATRLTIMESKLTSPDSINTTASSSSKTTTPQSSSSSVNHQLPTPSSSSTSSTSSFSITKLFNSDTKTIQTPNLTTTGGGGSNTNSSHHPSSYLLLAAAAANLQNQQHNPQLDSYYQNSQQNNSFYQLFSSSIGQQNPALLKSMSSFSSTSQKDSSVKSEDENDEDEDEDDENDDEDNLGNMNNSTNNMPSYFEDTDEVDDEEEDEDNKNELDLANPVLSQHHSNTKSSRSIESASGTTSQIKLEQNEKAIKKSKVIELYTRGERCVRKLSNITGVPLTTVYRVIGKLKGINYNIPRGNGAGRKTILDAQDREILVEILNKQPRISRKALGKELERATGKSIHNSTLNRELCRLRYQGYQSVAIGNLGASGTGGSSNESSLDNNGESGGGGAFQIKNGKKPSETYDKTSRTQTDDRLGLDAPISLTNKVIKLDSDITKQILLESKRFFSTHKFNMNPNDYLNGKTNEISTQIMEICNASNLTIRLEKTKRVVTYLLNKLKESSPLTENDIVDFKDDFYTACLLEACVQTALHRPILLMRVDELVICARKILDSCSINRATNSSMSQDTDVNNNSISRTKRIKLESPPIESHNNQQQSVQQQFIQPEQQNNLMHLYSALAYHLQNTGGLVNIDAQLKQNLSYQEELKLKLYALTTSLNQTNGNNTSPELHSSANMLIEQTQIQLNEAVKKYNELMLSTIAAAAAATAATSSQQHQHEASPNEIMFSPSLMADNKSS